LKTLAFLAQSHYLVAAMLFFTTAALVVSIIRYHYHRNLRIFTYYIAFSLVQDLTAYYAFPYGNYRSFRMVVMNLTGLGFMLFEFVACNVFILRYISGARRRKIVKISGLLFFAVLSITASITYPYYWDEYYIVPESVFLVIPCLIYFYELFLTMNLKPLTDQPAFWVVTGILFLSACNIPLLVSSQFLRKYAYFDEAYSLNYIFYSLLFLLLIKASLCPAERPEAMATD
jgi:hypothetical protein